MSLDSNTFLLCTLAAVLLYYLVPARVNSKKVFETKDMVYSVTVQVVIDQNISPLSRHCCGSGAGAGAGCAGAAAPVS